MWEKLLNLLNSFRSCPASIPAQPAPVPTPVPVLTPSGMPVQVKTQGWSKDIKDCTAILQTAWAAVHDEFIAKHPDLTLRTDYTWRSPELQQQLFEKGRTLVKGAWVVTDKSKVVTQLQKSHHSTYPAQAFDFIIFRNGQPIWATDKSGQALYVEAGNMFSPYGVVSGATWKYNWKDWDHIQQSYTII